VNGERDGGPSGGGGGGGGGGATKAQTDGRTPSIQDPRASIHERDRADWTVADPRAHDRTVRGMFARIARVYDFMNHLLSFNRDKAWRRALVSRLDADTWELLDLCAGTGDLGLEALRAGRCREVIAADFTHAMLVAGAGKGLARPGGVPAVTSDAQALPLRDACVDAVVVGFGVRNVADLRRCLREVRRVLRPGGQFHVVEFFRDDPAARGEARGPAAPVRWFLNRTLPLMGRLAGNDESAYGYLAVSMQRFLTPREYAALLEEHGFGEVTIDRMTLGIAHVVGGRVPAV